MESLTSEMLLVASESATKWPLGTPPSFWWIPENYYKSDYPWLVHGSLSAAIEKIRNGEEIHC